MINKSSVQDAVDLALFFRRSAHKRRRFQRFMIPEWNGQPNHMSDAANQNLRLAIRWIQIAKYRRSLTHAAIEPPKSGGPDIPNSAADIMKMKRN